MNRANLYQALISRKATVTVVLCLAVSSGWLAHAQDKPAVIKNKEFSVASKEMDAAVSVAKINGKPIEIGRDRVEVPAGEQEIEVECMSRMVVGMGTMDIGKTVNMAVKLDPGRVYKLGAKLDKKGDCTPTLE